MTQPAEIGIIGGSGFYSFLANPERVEVDTPFGAPSAPVAVGDEVVLFGEPTHGLPSAEAWADAADTIQRDVLTGVGRRVPRVAAPE